ncbi:MAG: NAD-dependent epimerase/dehydratase family protein [Candidatus Helarchaeota archaeon]
MEKILLLGGAGFIGSNLAKRLCDSHEIHVVDDLSGGDVRNIKDVSCKFHHADYRCFDLLSVKPDIIFHFACQKMIYSIEEPFRDLEINTKGTLQILEYCRKHDVPLIYVSSGSVYGNPAVFPTPEDYPCRPESPYGVSKWMAEEYCRLYYRMYGLDIKIVRPFSIYGPNQRKFGVVTRFILQALNDEPFTIEGDGNQRRAFTYVDDFIDGFLTVWLKGKSGETYNIANYVPYSINELASIISEALSVPLVKMFVSRKKGDLNLTYPSIKKIGSLGWIPKVDLREGVRRTLDWILDEGIENFIY